MATISSGGGNTTITITRTKPSAKLLATVNNFIKNRFGSENPLVVYNGTTVQFSAMTNQQKADAWEWFIVQDTLASAKGWNTAEEITAAVATAQTENDTDYDI